MTRKQIELKEGHKYLVLIKGARENITIVASYIKHYNEPTCKDVKASVVKPIAIMTKDIKKCNYNTISLLKYQTIVEDRQILREYFG